MARLFFNNRYLNLVEKSGIKYQKWSEVLHITQMEINFIFYSVITLMSATWVLKEGEVKVDWVHFKISNLRVKIIKCWGGKSEVPFTTSPQHCRRSWKLKKRHILISLYSPPSSLLTSLDPCPLSRVLRRVPAVIESFSPHSCTARQAAVSRWPPAIVWGSVFLSRKLAVIITVSQTM